jgi:hypothetical protein
MLNLCLVGERYLAETIRACGHESVASINRALIRTTKERIVLRLNALVLLGTLQRTEAKD